MTIEKCIQKSVVSSQVGGQDGDKTQNVECGARSGVDKAPSVQAPTSREHPNANATRCRARGLKSTRTIKSKVMIKIMTGKAERRFAGSCANQPQRGAKSLTEAKQNEALKSGGCSLIFAFFRIFPRILGRGWAKMRITERGRESKKLRASKLQHPTKCGVRSAECGTGDAGCDVTRGGRGGGGASEGR